MAVWSSFSPVDARFRRFTKGIDRFFIRVAVYFCPTSPTR